jgi:curved DNA-binding protein CbpA
MVTTETRLKDFDQPMTYYEILGIEPDASPKEIKSAYLQLANQYHPDHNYNRNDRRMVELNLIYDVLSHADKKVEYDGKFAPATLNDFSGRSSNSAASQQKVEQKTEYVNKTKVDYLKITRIGLTAALITMLSYLAFYLIVKILQFSIIIPDWLLNLLPK